MCLHTHTYKQTHTGDRKKKTTGATRSTPRENSPMRPQQSRYHVCAYTKCVIKAGAFLWRCLCVDCQHDLDTPPPSPLCTWKQETGHTHDFMYRGAHEYTPSWPSGSPPSSGSAKPSLSGELVAAWCWAWLQQQQMLWFKMKPGWLWCFISKLSQKVQSSVSTQSLYFHKLKGRTHLNMYCRQWTKLQPLCPPPKKKPLKLQYTRRFYAHAHFSHSILRHSLLAAH